MEHTKETTLELPSEGQKNTLEELKSLSKEELLKRVFDRSIASVKEKGHAQYAV